MLSLCSLRRPFFYVPATVLGLLLGLLGFVEHREHQRDDEIQVILEDKEPTLLYELHQATWNFDKALQNAQASGTVPQQIPELIEKTEAVHEKLNELLALLKENPFEMEEHKHSETDLANLRDTVLSLLTMMKDPTPLTDKVLITMQREAGIATHAIHFLYDNVYKTHSEAINERLEDNNRERIYRLILLSLILLSGVSLAVSLLYNARCMQRNAEAAHTAERFNAIFAAALQSLRVGIMIRDATKSDEPILFINNSFTDITGYSVDDVKNSKTDFLFGWNTDPETITSLRKTINAREQGAFAFLAYKKDGTPFWSEWHISPVLDKNGETTHYVVLLTDITPLRQTQEALVVAKEQAEHASAIKSQFLAVMSHEIRTPINGLLGVLNLLWDAALNEEQKRLITVAQSSGKSLLEIINDILDYAKMEAGKIEITLEPFSLRESIQGVFDITTPIAQSKGIELLLDMPESLPDKLKSDPGRLRQILLNLVGNAIKFTDQGRVTLRIIHLLNQEEQGEESALLRFEVIDTGIGISPADQEKLFLEFSQIERSYTRRFGGTGLGLAITRRLVRMLKGDIGVESKPGQGSKFWFMIPMILADQTTASRDDQKTNTHQPIVDTPALPQSARILLVEDNDTNRFVTSRYLTKAGFCPDVATNGLEAIEMTRTGHYDLILMDVSMPEMDGLEATQKIRGQGGWARTVPIIALTAHVMEGDRERCLAAGMDDYLNKPIEYNDLVRMMRHWLADAPAATDGKTTPTALPDLLPPQTYVDWNVLKTLEEELGRDSVQRVLGVFTKDLTQREAIFLKPFDLSHWDELSHEAHTIKSSSASCGLLPLSDLMRGIEAAAHDRDESLVSQLLQQVPNILKESKKALEEAIRRYA